MEVVSSVGDDEFLEDDIFYSYKFIFVYFLYKDCIMIDDFEIIKFISRGVFGWVFLVRKCIIGDFFVIKVLVFIVIYFLVFVVLLVIFFVIF